MAKKIKATVLDSYGTYRSPCYLKEVEGTLYTWEDIYFLICKDKYNYVMYELRTGLEACRAQAKKELIDYFENTVLTNKGAIEALRNTKSMITKEGKSRESKKILCFSRRVRKNYKYMCSFMEVWCKCNKTTKARR